MKIAIDIRSLQDEKHSGVQEYVLSTLRELFKMDNKNEYTLFSISARHFSNQAIDEIIKDKDNVTHRHIYFPNKIISFFWYFSNIPNLQKILDNPDKVFAPNLNVLPKKILKTTIITFHDLSFKYFPKYFSYKSRLWHKIIRPKRLAQEADQIIAVSESTKRDIIESYEIDKKKILHIPLGKSEQLGVKKNEEEITYVKQKYGLPDKFILFVGTLEPRKNIVGMIRALNLLLDKNKNLEDYKLILGGPRGWLHEKIFKVARLSTHKDKILFIGPIERSDRAFVYSMATVFIYPSFFEGFGLPLLEAMTCGTPIVTSNRSSIPSVVGRSAIMIDPYRIGEIAWAIESVIFDEELSQRLIKEGLKKSKEFSWKKGVEKLKKLIEKNHVKI
jgi:glycosyltransferase involved in cell wall biosynthesis